MLRGLIHSSLAVAILGGAGSAFAAPSRASGGTVIPSLRSIKEIEWKAISDHALYFRGAKGEWYLIRINGICSGLSSVRSFAIEASRGNQLDHHSAIWVRGVRCPIISIEHSGGPPRKSKRR